jgi:magnesium-transporting ATPase (P-type)
VEDTNNNFNDFNEKILSIIKDNFFKIISLLIVSFGLFYIGIYYFNQGFFPELNSEEFIQLSLLYFSTTTILSIIFTFMFFIPGEQIYQIKYASDKTDKIFAIFILVLILLIPVILISFLIKNSSIINIFKFLKNNIPETLVFFSTISSIIIFNKIYYEAKKNSDKKNIGFLIFIVWFEISFLLAPFFSNQITKVFHLGNYSAKLLLKNITICKMISPKNKNNETCLVTGKILWNIGNYYLIQLNNKKYKIPKEFILMEETAINNKEKK